SARTSSLRATRPSAIWRGTSSASCRRISDPMSPAPGQAPGQKPVRPPQNRMGSLFTLLLVLVMVLLVVNFFNDSTVSEDHNFQNLRRLAYQGEVTSIKFVGETRVEAKVHRLGTSEETWDVPVPEYAKTELAEMERLVARRVDHLSLPEVLGQVQTGKWR